MRSLLRIKYECCCLFCVLFLCVRITFFIGLLTADCYTVACDSAVCIRKRIVVVILLLLIRHFSRRFLFVCRVHMDWLSTVHTFYYKWNDYDLIKAFTLWILFCWIVYNNWYDEWACGFTGVYRTRAHLNNYKAIEYGWHTGTHSELPQRYKNVNNF